MDKPENPGTFQKLRGLRQYRQQQAYRAVEPESPETGSHALDEYFVRELGVELSPPMGEEVAAPGPERTGAFVEKGSPIPTGGPVAEEGLVRQMVPFETPKSQGSRKQQEPHSSNIRASEEAWPSPYRQFAAELSHKDLRYLIAESNATLQTLLLKNTSRSKRSQILQQMPRKQRALLLRSWAESSQRLDGDGFLRAFHWLRRKVAEKDARLPVNGETVEIEESYPEVNGIKVLSMILDGLNPEQEKKIMQSMVQNDGELAAWLERDRGSAEQRRILRRIMNEVNELERALLFSIPRYGRLLRHLLDRREKMAVLNASISLAQLSLEKRHQLESGLLANFPVLEEF
ncbi:MAG: hypothetical protein AAF975_01940 [Spirochaetota bacterium]